MQQLRIVRPKHCVIHEDGTLVEAFRSSPEAQAECVRLNLEGSEDGGTFEVVVVKAAPADLGAYALALVKAERAGAALLRAREEAQRAALGAWLAGSVRLFEEHPALQSFSWLQAIESWHEPWCEHFDEDRELTFTAMLPTSTASMAANWNPWMGLSYSPTSRTSWSSSLRWTWWPCSASMFA